MAAALSGYLNNSRFAMFYLSLMYSLTLSLIDLSTLGLSLYSRIQS